MSDMIKRDDVLRIIDGRFSGLMIGDILKQDINALPEAEMQTAGRQCKIDRCELFNRLATITAEDANEMKAKIYAVIQEMPAIPERVLQPVHVHIDTDELLEKIREEYELTDDIVRCKECNAYMTDGYADGCGFCAYHHSVVQADDLCSYGDRKTEPSICDGCKFYDGEDCYLQGFCKFKTEPQTETEAD